MGRALKAATRATISGANVGGAQTGISGVVVSDATEPLRLFLYAAVVVGLVGMTAAHLHRLLVWLFYTGAVLVTVVGLINLALGRSATDQFALSTGGTRLIAISTSIYCAGTLFLALLNFRLRFTTIARVAPCTRPRSRGALQKRAHSRNRRR